MVMFGEVVKKFNETFVWTHAHIAGDELEELRLKGDHLADDALPYLSGGMAVERLVELSQHIEAVQALHNQVMVVPQWVDFDQIERGQQLFWSYHPLCMMVLLNASLIGGFGSRKVTSTLQCTKYLTDKGTAWKRMLETGMMVQDVMSFKGLQVGAGGWRAAFKVRMMHAQARRHVLRQPSYDRVENGIPINQEDLLSTLMVFSTVIICSLRRLGVHISHQEQEDYIAVWRYVGYIMGVQDLHHFTTYNRSVILKESVMVHLLDPDESCAKLANNVIEACANRPPLFLSKASSAALTHLLLGHEWASQLGLPHSKLHILLMRGWVIGIRSLLQVANRINRTWTIHHLQSLSYRILNAQLGHRKPTYQFIPHQPNPKPFKPEGFNLLILLSLITILILPAFNPIPLFR
ncbi:hypothetical protein L0F63_003843 [Massospora cicadina]|nr:hypothetical protein L0F63_003843 [Massospora cicadina]